MASENENGRKEEEKSLPLVNTEDDPMATVEFEKMQEEIRLLHEEALTRWSGPCDRLLEVRKQLRFEGYSFQMATALAMLECETSPTREAVLARNARKLRLELIEFGLLDEGSPRRTWRQQREGHSNNTPKEKPLE